MQSIALRPGAGELLLLVLIPAVMILFSCVYGITVNLHFPVLEWDNEVRIVKQSASALLGGMGASILAATAVLYRRNNRFDICGKI